jgi:hypothetical protein
MSIDMSIQVFRVNESSQERTIDGYIIKRNSNRMLV